MKETFKKLLVRMPFIRNLDEQIKAQGAYPAGHFYSPIPSKNDVLEYTKSKSLPKMELQGIELNKEGQFKLLEEFTKFYEDIPFPERQTSGFRYYYENIYYSYSDAIFLHSFLRKYKPKRIIEVGSGFSSAVILDTVDRYFSFRPDISFIDPYPERLRSLLNKEDENYVRIIEEKLQKLQLDFFTSLEAGDLLFIDSSHVVKCNSDLHFLFFNIIPLLKKGVFVHFHDVFYPFDYPSDWLNEGRYWNENYFLRAFLSNNSEWDICFFNTYVSLAFNEFIKKNMPLCVRNSGGSLYIQRNSTN